MVVDWCSNAENDPLQHNETELALKNILSVDLEEWYHPEYVKKRGINTRIKRLPRSLNNTLDLLRAYDVSATFFIVGELVEKHPEIVEEINEKGHEVAFHGYHHEPLWKLNAKAFELEVKRFNSMTKKKCLGFRAPSFSLNNETRWALEILKNAGYIYDSSIFPVKTLLYGLQKAPMKPYKLSHEDVTKEDESGKLWEFPLLVYSIMGLRIPAAGGFYLRLFPTRLIERAVKKMNKHGEPAVIYIHNWELDSEMPRLKLGIYKSFVTYHNAEKTEEKMKHLLSSFKFTSLRVHMEEHGLLPCLC